MRDASSSSPPAGTGTTALHMAIEYDYDDVAEFLLSKARRELALTAWLPEGKTTWGGRTTLRAGGAFIFTRARHLTPRFASLRLLF